MSKSVSLITGLTSWPSWYQDYSMGDRKASSPRLVAPKVGLLRTNCCASPYSQGAPDTNNRCSAQFIMNIAIKNRFVHNRCSAQLTMDIAIKNGFVHLFLYSKGKPLQPSSFIQYILRPVINDTDFDTWIQAFGQVSAGFSLEHRCSTLKTNDFPTCPCVEARKVGSKCQNRCR